MIEIRNNRPNTLPDHILKVLERYWGFILPINYRNFLIQNNGGEVNLDRFCFVNKQDGSDIRSFLGIYPSKHNDLLSYLKLYQDRIPKNTFPIAYDSFGNLILLSVKGPDRGKIYFWDHDLEAEDGQEPDYSNLTLIADSFDEFINGLHSEDEIQV